MVSHSDTVSMVNEQHGNRIELRSISSRQCINLVEYTVLVPAGAFVTLRSSDGTPRAQGLRGDVVLEAASGLVEVTDISDAHLHVKTLDGPISLTDIRNSHLDIHSVRGNVDLHNVTGPAVEVNSGAGRITYDGDPGRVGEYLLTSHTGEGSLGVVRVLRSIWRGKIGEPKNSRSKASVPLIPQLNTFLEQHRERCGNPAFGPIFANGAGKPADLDALYHRQMEEPLRQAGIEWEGWHGFRRGLATNLERIGVRETIAAMILRHSNDRVTRKHYIKPPSIEAVSAMQRFSDTLTTMQKPQLLPECSPEAQQERQAQVTSKWLQ